MALQHSVTAAAAPARQLPIQRKTRVGPVDDPLEREADRVADAVVSGRPAGAIGGGSPGHVQRSCAACEAEEETLHRKQGAAPFAADAAPHAATVATNAVSYGGTPLSTQQRAYFEPRFGRDLTPVRLHTHDKAASAARDINARAYAVGTHIGFAAGDYAPGTLAGDRLLAHELAHVVQAGGVQGSGPIRRAPPIEGPKEEKPKDKIVFTAKDLLVYPLFVDLWNDIFRHKFTEAQKAEFKRKGKEGAAIWNLIFAGMPAGASPGAGNSLGDFLPAWLKHAKEIHKIAGGEDFHLDLFSTFVGISLGSYLGSDLFTSRLKSHASSVLVVLLLAQSVLSTIQARKKPSAAPGELEPTQWEKQTLLVTALFNILLKEQIKAPDFFSIGPLKLATHPAFAATSATAGGGPPELTFEHKKGEGEGQGGELLKLGLTLNLPQIVERIRKGGPSAKELADLQKYRGWQGSLWFSFDRTDPTALQREAGKLPSKAFHVGALFGGGGLLGELAGGARYGGDAAENLTAWFLHGGYGYSGKKGAVIRKFGFTADFTDWTEHDILAPRLGEDGTPVGGWAARLTPFTKLEFGKRHKVGVGAALGFVTGTHENFGVSDFRGDLSYTYMGDRSETQLPVFSVNLAASVGRLDWWNPNSPLLTGVQARASFKQFFVAGQLNTGAGKIPDARALQIAGKPSDTVKVQVPTTVLFSGGVYF